MGFRHFRKDKIRRKLHLAIYVFISHAWDYSDHYTKLSEWVFHMQWHWTQNNQPIYFENTSIPKNDPVHARGKQALENAIANRIAQSHVIVAPSGLYASHSEWIKFELQVAMQFNIPIVQVNPWAQEKKSTIVQQYANHEVGWNSQSVVNAIIKAVT